MTNNKHRAHRVAVILSDAIIDGDDHDTALRDLLTDIRHYCDDQGFDFHETLRVSYDNYLAELPLNTVRARAGL